jgi:hypothetical protein
MQKTLIMKFVIVAHIVKNMMNEERRKKKLRS